MFSINRKQWYGLGFSLIMSSLIWAKMVFIIAPAKNQGEKVSLGKYEYLALGISLLIAVISWLKLVAAVG